MQGIKENKEITQKRKHHENSADLQTFDVSDNIPVHIGHPPLQLFSYSKSNKE